MKAETKSKLARTFSRITGLLAFVTLPAATHAAGILTPVGSTHQPLTLESHHVRVVINNGFARTEVEQVFSNPNPVELEAIYQAPVPENGALSELTIWAGERVLQGEVVTKEEADRIYEEEKSQGNEVGKASQDSYRKFEFNVYPVPAQGEVRMRYLYYEPLPIDTGVGRYTYRLEEGGTDEEAEAFWTLGDVVQTDFSIEVELKSAWPVARTRTPGFAGTTETVDPQTLRYRFSSPGAQLDQDFVFYYMLEPDLPGRLEMLAYRENEDKPGTFMMVMTPGVDLAPLVQGSDFVFVLDVSGSMSGKLHTLVAGVKKAIGQLRPQDRFRVVAFNDQAWDVTKDWIPASPENVERMLRDLDALRSNGGTNVYEGIELGLRRMDADRVSSLVLVTDGVTNQGIVDPARFYKLLHSQDVRFFGFLLGNSSNWPLMRLMCEASGGHYRAVSNSDDIIGEILIAKNKIAYESMHHAELSIEGVKTFDVSDFRLGKVHYGDQLILFGRYEEAGPATVRLIARIGGEEKIYSTDIEFPDTSVAHPELERLWALDQVQKIQLNQMAGFLDSSEAEQAVSDIGVAYQIVTDETSMIALADEDFARHGIQRRNQQRIAVEQVAAQASPQSRGARRVDTAKPMYTKKAPSFGSGGGGGAVEPWMFLLALSGVLVWRAWSRKGPKAKGVVAALAFAGTIFALGAGQQVRADVQGGASSSSIDHSIASFWQISEEEARLASPRAEKSPERPPERRRKTDSHTVRQSRRDDHSDHHFGISLFNAIPVIDFVWGGRNRTESDEYAGSLER